MAIRKIPQRKCIGCNVSKDKRDLIRVVKSPQGEILLDLTGKKPGRGAYICNSLNCLRLAEKARRLEKTFECQINKEVYEKLLTEISENEQ